jgi:hypothetical protein
MPCATCGRDTLHIKQKCQECGSIFLPKTSFKEAINGITRGRFKKYGQAAGRSLIAKRRHASKLHEKATAAAYREGPKFNPEPEKDIPADTHGRGAPGVR